MFVLDHFGENAINLDKITRIKLVREPGGEGNLDFYDYNGVVYTAYFSSEHIARKNLGMILGANANGDKTFVLEGN